MTRHSLLMVVAGLVSGASAYLYQLSMGILLTPTQYATLLSLTSLLLVVSVFGDTITLTIAKLTSKLKAEDRLGAVGYVRHRFLKFTFLAGILTFSLAAALSPLLSRFLDTDSYVYPIVLSSSFIFAFPLSGDWGVMQGLQRFPTLAAIRVLWASLRPALGVLLVSLGFALSGGLAAIPLSYAVTLIITIILLRDLSHSGYEKVEIEKTGLYTSLTLVALFSITMLSNIDVVLAKHYLPSIKAESYSAISILGRICFYAPMGVALAMFPKTSESFESGGRHRILFTKAALLAILIVTPICLIYAIFPDHVVHLIFSDKYTQVAPYVFKYGLAMSLLSLSYLAMTYFLSIGRTKIAYLLLAAMLIQLGLICLYHSSVAQLINDLLISGIVSVILVLLLFFARKERSPIKTIN